MLKPCLGCRRHIRLAALCPFCALAIACASEEPSVHADAPPQPTTTASVARTLDAAPDAAVVDARVPRSEMEDAAAPSHTPALQPMYGMSPFRDKT